MTTTIPSPTNTTDFTPIIDDKCSIYQNSTGFIIKEYNGIPENLIVNVVVWFVLLVLFTFLRRIGDYGRFGLLKKDEERRLLKAPSINRYNINRKITHPFNRLQSWNTRLFGYWQLDEGAAAANFVDNDSISSSPSDHDQSPNNKPHEEEEANGNVQSSPVLSNGSSKQSTSSSSNNSTTPINVDRRRTSSAGIVNHRFAEYNDKYFFSWIVNMYKLKDKHIEEKCGKDAIYYLTFQRYLIIYLLIVTILSISILLPINFSGSALSDNKVFGSTTIVNVDPNSNVLWVHLCLSWLYLILGFIFMRVFSKRMQYTEAEYVSRTVLIMGLPFFKCDKDVVIRHFNEAYPNLIITDIQFAYDISKLTKLDSKKRAMHIGKTTSMKIFEKTNVRPVMHPFNCGSFIELCCCCFSNICFKSDKTKLTDAIEYYTKNEADYKIKIIQSRNEALKKPLGIVFVTFQNQKMAAEFLRDYNFGIFGHLFVKCCPKYASNPASCYLCRHFPKTSHLSAELKSNLWSVKYAPSPSNIKWENISRLTRMWWFRIVLINLLLVIMMIFFTTPAILLEKLNEWAGFFDLNSLENKIPTFLQEFLPSMLLRILAALLPVIVAWTSLAELHWTRSSENKSMMIKTFNLLLFMLLILPTLGLTSINAIFQWLNKDVMSFKWRCISDNGAFFLKYVTTCSFIGTALDLLRLPDLLLYLIKLFWSRSLAERLNCRMQAAFEFDYGIHYAWFLTVFTMTLSFSVVCPLIAPFGLTYLVLKHVVDRYNIFFAYMFTKVNKNIHKTAVTFKITSLIILQFCILFFIAVRNKGSNDAMSIVQIVVTTLSCIIFFGRLFFGIFKRFSPFKKEYTEDEPVVGEYALKPNSNSFRPNLESEADGSRSTGQKLSDTEMIGDLNNNSSETEEKVTDLDENHDEVQINQPKPSASAQPARQVKKFSKADEIQSPFVPGLLRSSSPILKLTTNTNATGGNETDTDVSIINLQPGAVNRRSNLSPLPLEPGQIEIDLAEQATRTTSPTSNRLHYGALNRAAAVLFKKSSTDNLNTTNENDQVKINQGYQPENENENGSSL